MTKEKIQPQDLHKLIIKVESKHIEGKSQRAIKRNGGTIAKFIDLAAAQLSEIDKIPHSLHTFNITQSLEDKENGYFSVNCFLKLRKVDKRVFDEYIEGLEVQTISDTIVTYIGDDKMAKFISPGLYYIKL